VITSLFGRALAMEMRLRDIIKLQKRTEFDLETSKSARKEEHPK
jgi:hypothetical protein